MGPPRPRGTLNSVDAHTVLKTKLELLTRRCTLREELAGVVDGFGLSLRRWLELSLPSVVSFTDLTRENRII